MKKGEKKRTDADEMLKDKDETGELDQKENRVYELGFLLNPNISEDKIGVEFSSIKKIIEKNNSVFVSEEFPKIKKLEYTIFKASHGGKERHDSAYFSWIKFETAPSSIDKIFEEMKKEENVIRFLIIKTTKEDTMTIIRRPFVGVVEKRKIVNKKEETGVSKEELDKTIDELVIN